VRSALAATAAVVGGLLFGAAGFAVRDNSGTQAALPPPQSVTPSVAPSTSPSASPTSPASPGIPQSGEGTFRRAGGSAPRVGTGKVLRYRVEVERGIDEDPAKFAEWVDQILADPGGWTARGRWAFQRPRAGSVDFVVRLATPDTVDKICGSYGLDTGGEVSCRGGPNVIINLKRWELAIPSYNGDTYTYRHLVVNHEVGHFLGHKHETCPGKGKPAPVMQTQIYGMNGCVPNGWPYPTLH
jgi:hypothetical protein